MMTETELMEDHYVLVRRRASGWGTEKVLYFRADKVVKLLQERNEYLQAINDRLAMLVERAKAKKELGA